MWSLYTHDCGGNTWSLITTQESATEPLIIPDELRSVGDHYFRLGFHVGLRYTAGISLRAETLVNGAARMLRVVSLTTTKPNWCQYEEPADDRRQIPIDD